MTLLEIQPHTQKFKHMTGSIEENIIIIIITHIQYILNQNRTPPLHTKPFMYV